MREKCELGRTESRECLFLRKEIILICNKHWKVESKYKKTNVYPKAVKENLSLGSWEGEED